MKYDEFLDFIQNQTKSTAGKGGSVRINHIIKNNGRELDGLVILEKDCSVSPTIYLNQYYEQHRNGRELSEIVNEILVIYRQNRDRIQVNTNLFNEFLNVRSMIVYRVVNYQQNLKLLNKIPHKKFLDLAVIYYCLLEQTGDGNATALIYNTHVSQWGVTEDDIFEAAIENTPKLLKSNIKPMSDLLKGMVPFDDEMIECCQEEVDSEEQMYVLTNQSKIHGASCMLYEDVLKEFSEKLGQDLYILPSSIHEVILLPKSDSYDREGLNCMVKEVNMDGVSLDEILSDHVYEYNRASGMIEM